MNNEMLGTITRGTYVTANANGKFAKKVPLGTIGAIERMNKFDKPIAELLFDFVKGHIDSVTLKDGTYGQQWNIVIRNGEDRVIVQFEYTSNYAKGFLKMLPNIILTEMVELRPSAETVDGENKTSLFIYQNGEMVKYAFKKEDGKLPDRVLVKDPKTGKDTWSYIDQMNFLGEQAAIKMGTVAEHSDASPAVEPGEVQEDAASTEENDW